MLVLSACAGTQEGDARFAVSQAELAHRGQIEPLIRVQTSAGTPLVRNDWQEAEAAAAAYCTEQGARFQMRPTSRTLTQIIFEDGVFDFVAECLPLTET